MNRKRILRYLAESIILFTLVGIVIGGAVGAVLFLVSPILPLWMKGVLLWMIPFIWALWYVDKYVV